MDSKKNKIIPILMFLIIILLIILIIIKYTNNDDNKYQNNGVYIKEVERYINDNLYSITTIKILLDNGNMTYTKTIDYTDPVREGTEYTYSDTYKENNNIINTRDNTFYVNENNLCIDIKDCQDYLSKKQKVTYKEYINDFNLEDYIFYQKNINPQEEKQIYYISDKYIKEKTVEYIVYDYDLKINVININTIPKKNRKEIIEKYDLTNYPTLIILDKNKIYFNEEINESNIPKILESNGFKSR